MADHRLVGTSSPEKTEAWVDASIRDSSLAEITDVVRALGLEGQTASNAP